jgi:hypothetical protein
MVCRWTIMVAEGREQRMVCRWTIMVAEGREQRGQVSSLISAARKSEGAKW